MSNYGDPGHGHVSAMQAVAEARQNAHTAVSKIKQAGPPPHNPHLAPADTDRPALATIATQAVADYLTQLRPYRSSSSGWGVRFGTLELPAKISGGKRPGFGRGQAPDLRICRPPEVHIENVSDFVDVANMTVQFSSKRQNPPGDASPQNPVMNGFFDDSSSGAVVDVKYTIRTGEYGELTFDDRSTYEAVLKGALTPSEAVEFAATEDQEESDDDDDLVLGDPNVSSRPGDTRGRDNTVKSFNLVFPAGELKRFFELGDDIAEELGVLGDIEAPDHSAGPGGAV